MEAVEIETVEGRARLGSFSCIVPPQPVNKAPDLVVAPHPGRKARKRGPLRRRKLEVPDIMVDARGIRPIAFDGDEVESLFVDERTRDLLAQPIELRGAVRRLADEHDASLADAAHERVKVDEVDGPERLALPPEASIRLRSAPPRGPCAPAARAPALPRPSPPRPGAARSGHRRCPRS